MNKLKEFGIYYVTFWKELYEYAKPMRVFLIIWLLSVIGVTVFFCSCSTKVPFTSELKSEYGLDNKAMKRIQFYTSKKIVLVKSGGTSYLKTKDGAIVLNDVKKMDVITIKKGTPCLVDSIVNHSVVVVSFEKDTNATLFFCTNKYGTYSLCADVWEGENGVVQYGNTKYVTSGVSGSSCLTIKLKKLSSVSGRSKTLSGRKLNE